jgi:hypothetical protein
MGAKKGQIMETRSDNVLENLDAKTRAWVFEIASQAERLSDVMEALKEVGIDVSVSTLQRFVRKHREERVVSEGEEMAGVAEKLAGRGRGETFRKGTMEALRQKLYEEALSSKQGTTETMEMYESLLREEAKLKELELAERKTAALEERVRLERERLELAARAKLPAGERTRVEVGNEVVVEEVAGGGAREGFLLEALRCVEVIVNKGGPAEEKVLELRLMLGGHQKLLVSG